MVHPALERFLADVKPLADALGDAWFVVDHERNLVAFNRAFFSLAPRAAGRTPQARKCYEVVELSICRERCAGEQCGREGRTVRLEDIEARAPGAGRSLRLAVTAIPIFDEEGRAVGAMEIHRDVTDHVVVQGKYQEVLEREAREREILSARVRERTRELLATHDELMRARRALAGVDPEKG